MIINLPLHNYHSFTQTALIFFISLLGSGAVLGTRDMQVNKTLACPQGTYTLVEMKSKQLCFGVAYSIQREIKVTSAIYERET